MKEKWVQSSNWSITYFSLYLHPLPELSLKKNRLAQKATHLQRKKKQILGTVNEQINMAISSQQA